MVASKARDSINAHSKMNRERSISIDNVFKDSSSIMDDTPQLGVLESPTTSPTFNYNKEFSAANQHTRKRPVIRRKLTQFNIIESYQSDIPKVLSEEAIQLDEVQMGQSPSSPSPRSPSMDLLPFPIMQRKNSASDPQSPHAESSIPPWISPLEATSSLDIHDETPKDSKHKPSLRNTTVGRFILRKLGVQRPKPDIPEEISRSKTIGLKPCLRLRTPMKLYIDVDLMSRIRMSPTMYTLQPQKNEESVPRVIKIVRISDEVGDIVETLKIKTESSHRINRSHGLMNALKYRTFGYMRSKA